MLKISTRLKNIADKIQYQSVADIGSDHGYLPIYLALEGRINRAIACDINLAPLQTAESNIAIHGVGHIVNTTQSNGLEALCHQDDSYESLVIAGMGGLLIINILNSHLALAKTFQQIILQPQSEIEKVRRFLHSIGFKINNEEIIKESNHYYFVIDTKFGNDVKYSDKDYILGRKEIQLNNETFHEYTLFRMEKNKKILNRIDPNLHSSRVLQIKNELSILES